MLRLDAMQILICKPSPGKTSTGKQNLIGNYVQQYGTVLKKKQTETQFLMFIYSVHPSMFIIPCVEYTCEVYTVYFYYLVCIL